MNTNSNSAQASMEYLMTYGWAMILIVSVAAVLFFVVSPNFGESEACVGTAQMLCVEHIVSEEGALIMTLQNGTGKPISNVVAEFSGDFSGSPGISKESLAAGEQFTVTGDTGLGAGESYKGIVSINYKTAVGYNRIEEIKCTGKSEGVGIAASEITLDPVEAIGYQDPGEGTGCQIQENHLSLVSSLDGQWAVNPSTCSGINYNYYANGTSSSYFDALALRFDVAGYSPATYDATLRLYIRDGGYSSAWHQYKIYSSFMDNSECYDVSPGSCTNVASFANGYEGWIEVPLQDLVWQDGGLSVRIWDARVDKAELKLESG
ncbi:MAG: hypothetical protein JW772_01120 [Candidatus Diapherotrites archaeon]|nr:hypothetical protein [Candidatus Diapherotrites archaeon]